MPPVVSSSMDAIQRLSSSIPIPVDWEAQGRVGVFDHICGHLDKRLVCKVARVMPLSGGMFSNYIDPSANSCLLASFTVPSPHALLYNSTVNLWMVWRSSEPTWSTGVLTTWRSDTVSRSNVFHTSQHVFFPRPENDDTVSHPVKLWKS